MLANRFLNTLSNIGVELLQMVSRIIAVNTKCFLCQSLTWVLYSTVMQGEIQDEIQSQHFLCQHLILTQVSFFTERNQVNPCWSVLEGPADSDACLLLFSILKRHFLFIREIHDCSGKTLQRDMEEIP